MPERTIPVYPQHYTPSDLDFILDPSFEDANGTVFSGSGMQLVSGARGTWRIRIENRERDLPAGAVMALVRFNYQIAYHLQQANPTARDYTTIETDSGAVLKLITRNDGVNLLDVVVESGVFRKGDTCTVTVGERRHGGVGSEVFWSATDGQYLLAVDVDGSGEFHGVEGNPFEFSVVHRPEVDLLRLLGPTVAKTGEPFALHLGAFDQNRNVVESYAGRVDFEIPDGVIGLPQSYRFTAEDRGLKIFEGITIARAGVYRIGLRGESVDGDYLSNPTVASEVPEAHVYWGDVHAHGWGDASMHLMFLRTEKMDPLSRHQQGHTVGRFDFASPGAMSMDPDKREETWEAWRDACKQIERPGRYIPFIGYEAHPACGAGDRQVIFKDYREEAVPPSMKAPMEEVDAIYGERDDVLLEVHIGGQPPKWDSYRPARERFLEICSGFGPAEWLLQEALKLGYRPGVCAASDLHVGLMGGPRAVEPFRGRFAQKYPMTHRDSAYGTGPITAVVAPELTRDALWDAMTGRSTYASSGAHIYLRLTCDGVPASGEVTLGGETSISIACHACAPLDRVDLIVGEHCVRSWSPEGLDFCEDVVLSASDLPGNWIYLRVAQADGEYAWSSPTFLHRDGEIPSPGDLPVWNLQEEVDLSAFGENDATPHLADLKAYLELEEHIGRFQEITPVAVEHRSVGTCALFYCLWGQERIPMSIRWYFEFEIPRIRYDFGWHDYGAYDENELGPRLMAKYE